MNWGSIHLIGQETVPLSKASRLALGHSEPPVQCVLGARSPGVKLQRREANYLPPSRAQVKGCRCFYITECLLTCKVVTLKTPSREQWR